MNTNSELDKWNDFSVITKNKNSTTTELYQSFTTFRSIFGKLPRNELVKKGWIDSKDDIYSLLYFFRDIHSDSGPTLFRKKDEASDTLCALWLSKVKHLAESKIITKKHTNFQPIQKEYLRYIAKLSIDTKNLLKLEDILAEKGIVLIYCRSLHSLKLDGVVFRLPSGNPVIGMSLRYPRLDYFWFTLLHELSHIALHLDIINQPIVDNLDIDSESEIEVAANRLAKNSFVERSIWRNCPPKYDKSFQAISDFANEVGIHKSIVAGMLRKEYGSYKAYSEIVNEINVREVIFGHD